MVVAWGVDYAWSPHPKPSTLKAQGKTFACRYIGTNIDDGKMLTASELASLRAAGVDVVANVEGSAGGFRGYAAGQRWANSGVAWIDDKGLNMPAGRPIYFSADWDVSSADWPDLKAALDGAASIIGRDRVGLYGGRYAIQKAKDSGAAKWLWQTYGWSGSPTVWVPGVHIQQYNNGVRIDDADCDLNRAMLADFGQWGYQEVPDVELTDKIYGQGDNPTDNPNRTVKQVLQDQAITDGLLRGAFGAKTAGIKPDAPIVGLLDVPSVVAAQAADIEDIKRTVAVLAGQPAVQLTQDQINEAVYEALRRVFAPTA